MKDINKEKL